LIVCELGERIVESGSDARMSGSHWSRDLFYPLADLDNLDCASLRMRLDTPSRGPRVSLVVMVDIGEQQTRFGLVQDDSDIGVGAHRQEVRVARLVDPVHLQTGMLLVGLQVEGRRLHRLLVRCREASQSVGKLIGDAKVHAAPSLNQLLFYLFNSANHFPNIFFLSESRILIVIFKPSDVLFYL
jgi:hypothetical protein